MNQYAIDFDKGLLLGRAVKIVKKLAESPLADSEGEPILADKIYEDKR